MIEIIPVLDLMSGMAVSGKSGMRETYKPLKTVFANSSNPMEIALSLERQGARRIYIADLDAIENKGSNLELVQKINHILPVMLDFGVRNIETYEFALNFASKVIVATETLNSLEDLHLIFEKFPKERIVVSVDIKYGELYSNEMDLSLGDLKDELINLNPSEIILLDISQVGTEKGFNYNLIKEFEPLKNSLILGGGINLDGISDISSTGVNKVLIGSALHNGKFPLVI
ncbi:HisA/HisF family protein [Methanobacterium alcaliphilum]|uniref:HisA/HisF family protein n=1 Tax=Methanobacterium alcaliphilum TaxID=392018 RepID=UPI00200B8509|nr:HisA/HisF family protein [Methanobacterium alcaliphilum]MCK9152045.1 HisA/HisF family protein [Methanobacterium alcaliphilum]